MRVTHVIGEGIPNPTSGGGALTAWTVVSHLLDQGHAVRVVCVLPPEAEPLREERLARLRELGASVSVVPSRAAEHYGSLRRDLRTRARRAWRPEEEELNPYLVDAPAVRASVAETEPDAVFVYHFEGLAASRTVDAPRLAAVGDPPHLPVWYRLRDGLPHPRALRGLVRVQAVLRHQPDLAVRLLNECSACGAFAAHHAARLRRRGAVDCEYLRTPVPDPLGDGWRAERDRMTAHRRPRLLLLGHLRGIVTIDGLRVFAQQVLPTLERRLGADGFEVRVVGGHEPPPEVRRAFARPSVRLLGHLEQPDEELKTADALLVPSRIPLGIRVRIVTAFSYGCPVVTHESSRLGIPELDHGRNALVGRSGRDLAEAFLRLVSDAELKERLERGGRETYERWFAPRVAAGRIAAMLERIVRRPAAVPAR